MVNGDFLANRISPTNGYVSELNGGEFAIGYHNGGALVIGGGIIAANHFLVLTTNASNPPSDIPTMRATQAARIDRKLDDGIPISGTVQGNGCITGGGLYDESNQATGCRMGISLTN